MGGEDLIMTTSFTGRIVNISPLEQGTSRRGTQYKKIAIKLESEEQFPQQIIVTMLNQRCDEFLQAGFQVGHLVTALLNFRVSTNQDGTREYNEVGCWRMTGQ